jgi:rhamnogalacturonyl hydrolase YesR
MLAMQRRPWEQGIAAQALLELGDLGTMTLLARDSVYLQIDDGRLAMPGDRDVVTDPAVNGSAVLAAARYTGDSSLFEAAHRQTDYLRFRAPRTEDGVLYHINSAPQVWIDSFYMAPPFLAAMGYFDDAIQQMDGLKRYLWNPETRLFSHIWDTRKQVFTRGAWGVGNGWAAAGYARVIDSLPATHTAQRDHLIADCKAVIAGCLAYQREDGLFHDFVTNPATFVEVNLAQMLAYTIYRGIRGGWLSKDYRAVADLMRAAAHQRVDTFGFVRDVCGAPEFDRPGIATEGQAFFLLMEAAFADLLATSSQN